MISYKARERCPFGDFVSKNSIYWLKSPDKNEICIK
jgi:hypothetical protein